MDEKKIKRWQCEDGFAVESDEEEEIVRMVKMHSKARHDMEMSDGDIKFQIKEKTIEGMGMMGEEV